MHLYHDHLSASLLCRDPVQKWSTAPLPTPLLNVAMTAARRAPMRDHLGHRDVL
jgi:hypothetical protein